MSAMICAWTETSSAVVGSSAMMSSRLGAERQRDHHALAHAAGELVRVAVDAPLRRGNADLREQVDGAPARACGGQSVMGADRLDQLLADPVERIEAGQRILEDHADALAADPAHLFGRQVVDARARQPDLAARDPPGRIDEADHGGTRYDLPAPDSPTTPSTSPLAMSNEMPSRPAACRAACELDAQIADGEDGFGQRHPLGHRSFGLSASRSQSPRRLIGEHEDDERDAGKATIHHSPENRKSLPIRISVPSDGCVGGMPSRGTTASPR